jgi:hypothetical protein
MHIGHVAIAAEPRYTHYSDPLHLPLFLPFLPLSPQSFTILFVRPIFLGDTVRTLLNFRQYLFICFRQYYDSSRSVLYVVVWIHNAFLVFFFVVLLTRIIWQFLTMLGRISNKVIIVFLTQILSCSSSPTVCLPADGSPSEVHTNDVGFCS